MRFVSEGKSNTAQLIFRMGVDPTLKNNKGYSAMDIATFKGLKSLIALCPERTELLR